MLRQLKRNGDISRQIDRLAVPCSRPEAYLCRYSASFFIQSMAKSMNQALYQHSPACGESNTQYHVALNPHFAGLACVLDGWL